MKRHTLEKATQSPPSGEDSRWSKWIQCHRHRSRRPGRADRRLRGSVSALRLLPHVAHRLPAAQQCEGCTFFNGQVRELAYLHSRDVTYATFCEGPYEQSLRYRDFMEWDVPWYSARDSGATLLAGRWFGMQVCYLRDGGRVFETYWTSGRAAETMTPTYGLLDRTAMEGRNLGGFAEGWPRTLRGERRAVPHGWPTKFPMVPSCGRAF